MHPNGTVVYLYIANGPNHGRPQPTRARAPGTLTQWETIAENPARRP
jgi:hypothetical protein